MVVVHALSVVLFYGAVFAGIVILRQWARSDLERWLERERGQNMPTRYKVGER
jgi:hypothetical protein